MERLTRKSDSGMVWFIDWEHERGCVEREPCEMDPHHARLAIDKLAEYEDLEEQGKLLKLPCAVGDTVYEVQELRKRIQPYTIIAVHVSNCGNLYGWELKDGKGVYSNVNGFSEYAIGKSVFLTREEAEAALKKLEGKEE